ncbi:MAG: lipid-A-disaccharide synthase [Mariprofundaceae bacterium]
MHILLSAGEVSGDMHASKVIQSMRDIDPALSFCGIAGEYMQEAGCEPLATVQELNVMGFGDVIRAIPRIRKIEKLVLSWAEENKPEVAILVDYPGFNMRLGRQLRQMGVPVLQYIAPKLWSWGKQRSRRLSLSQDRLACILPFEPEWFAGVGIQASYVGNPCVHSCSKGWTRKNFCQMFQFEDHRPIVALLPGSRPGELRRHVPLLTSVLKELRGLLPQLQFVVSKAAGVNESKLSALTKYGAKLIDRSAPGFALPVDAAVAVSGTATLELALWNVPTVLIYRSSPAHITLGRWFATVKHVGLANIIMGDCSVMPELIQKQCTVANILEQLLPLIQSGEVIAGQKQVFKELRSLLGEKDPAKEVANLALSLAGPQVRPIRL